MTRRYWTCRSVSEGIPCRAVNPATKRKCERCGKHRPQRKKPAHMVALDRQYADYVALNGGDHCAICQRPRPATGRRLDRDHDHRTGRPRGLLCHRCNRLLPNWVTPDWLRAAAVYLERTEATA